MAGQDNQSVASPFEGATYKFNLANGKIYYVPWGIINKYPCLAAACKKDHPRYLPAMTAQQAGAVMDFLFRDNYSSFSNQAQGANPREKQMSLLRDHLRVYEFAAAYEIVPLAELAMCEIEEIGQHFNYYTFIGIMGELEYYLTKKEHLLAEYLTRKGAMAGETLSTKDAKDISTKLRDHITIENILLERVVKMKLELQKYEKMYGPLP